MKFLTAQPDSDYYVWQLKVQMNNFRKLGIEKDSLILMGYNKKKGINPNALKFKDSTTAIVLFFEDTRKNIKYISSIRPHIIKKLYKTKYEVVDKQDIFYHDCDVLFREVPNFKELRLSDKVMMSDTISYVGSRYIVSKGSELLDEMCAVVGIDRRVVEARDRKSGGAQTFIPNIYKIDYAFWNKIEKDSEKLYVLMNETAHKYNPQHPIQSWTADMWAVLWNLWVIGAVTEISPELNFTWPTNNITDWDRNKIMHNAGVTANNKNLFNKGEFIDKSPFEADLSYVDKTFVSYKYVEEILDAKNNFK